MTPGQHGLKERIPLPLPLSATQGPQSWLDGSSNLHPRDRAKASSANDTRALLALICPLLPNIWRDGHRYQKGGVMQADFIPDSIQKGDRLASEQPARGGPRSNTADAGDRQDQSGRAREGLLWCKRTEYQRIDDETGATQPPLYYQSHRDTHHLHIRKDHVEC